MAGDGRIGVFIVIGDNLLRLGLRTVLRTDPVLWLAGDAVDRGRGVAEAARSAPRVVIVEAELPDGSGIEACQEIRAGSPSTSVIVLGEDFRAVAVWSALRAGASGYLSTRTAADSLVHAIHAVAAGGVLVDRRAAHTLFLPISRGADFPAGQPLLSALERQLLALVAEGKTNREIAAVTTLSEKAVKTRLARAFDKLNVSRRAEAAVVFAKVNGDEAPRALGFQP